MKFKAAYYYKLGYFILFSILLCNLSYVENYSTPPMIGKFFYSSSHIAFEINKNCSIRNEFTLTYKTIDTAKTDQSFPARVVNKRDGVVNFKIRTNSNILKIALTNKNSNKRFIIELPNYSKGNNLNSKILLQCTNKDNLVTITKFELNYSALTLVKELAYDYIRFVYNNYAMYIVLLFVVFFIVYKKNIYVSNMFYYSFLVSLFSYFFNILM